MLGENWVNVYENWPRDYCEVSSLPANNDLNLFKRNQINNSNLIKENKTNEFLKTSNGNFSIKSDFNTEKLQIDKHKHELVFIYFIQVFLKCIL